MAQLAPSARTVRRAPMPLATLFAGVFLAGTGSATQLPPNAAGYLPVGVRFSEFPVRRMAGAKVKRIMAGMGISAAALARVLGVSRQTLYNWINGDQASEIHVTRIDALVRAHEALLTVDEPQRPLLTKPVRASQNFWQLVQAGEDPEVLAQAIRVTHERRADQRVLTAARLAAKRAKGTLVDGSSDDLT